MGAIQQSNPGEAPFPIAYYAVQPNKWTFESDKIRHWVESHLRGRVLNATAGKTRLEHDREIVRNDINEDRDAQYHYDVAEIAEHLPHGSFDTIVHDPPFSANQADKNYAGNDISKTAEVVRQYDKLLRDGGRVIGFGFTTTLMPAAFERESGERVEYERKAVAIFNTFGRMNDWLGTVDEMVPRN